MPPRRPSGLATSRARSGRRWGRLLPLLIPWVVAAPARAQAPAFLVRDINAVPVPTSSNPGSLVQIGATTFFLAGTPQTGRELWKSDGTEAGTVLVKDIGPGSQGSEPNGLVEVNGTLFFRASDGVTGFELWKSDGTQAGTLRVKDILPGSGSSLPSSLPLLNVNGTLFFAADDGVRGIELWRSDGTEAGTLPVKDIRPGSSGSFPCLRFHEDNTFFTACDNLHADDEDSQSQSTEPFSFLLGVNGTLFFAADDGVTGVELWKSDGTEAGTLPVKDICPGGGSPFVPAEGLSQVGVNGTLFFAADDGVTGRELWKSDGTQAGTLRVKDIADPYSSSPSSFVDVNGTLFFAAADGVRGRELWKSDGTEAGTVRVKDITNPGLLTDVGGTLYFQASDNGFADYELWKSDGTEAGTLRVKDIVPGSQGSNPHWLVDVNGTLFFGAFDGVRWGLWKSDGTEAGTVRVKDISSVPLLDVDGTLFFTADDGVGGSGLWKSDGTEAGTVLVKDLAPQPPGSSSSEFSASFIGTDQAVFFGADDGVTGTELWRSDGTEVGTVRVKDIRPGRSGSTLSSFVDVNETLFFGANDGVRGQELWKSDGTEAGTR